MTRNVAAALALAAGLIVLTAGIVVVAIEIRYYLYYLWPGR